MYKSYGSGKTSVILTKKADFAYHNIDPLEIYEEDKQSPCRFHVIGCLERRWITHEQLIEFLEDLAEIVDYADC